jgi:hypothetical protein
MTGEEIMNIEKMREEFEAVAGQHFLLRERFHCWDEAEGEYNDPDVQLAYEFFVLSRESLVIELPAALDAKPYACYEGGWNDMRGESVDAIEAAGLKVKP